MEMRPFLTRKGAFMRIPNLWRWSAGAALVIVLSWSEAMGAQAFYEFPPHGESRDDVAFACRRHVPAGTPPDLGWRQRVLTDRELLQITACDPELSPSIARHILSKLNARAPYYIDEDIKAGRPIKVPNSFEAYKKWTPLKGYLAELKTVPQFILISKDLHFIGWYENGKMVGDSYICIGKEDAWTKAGLYTVKNKDADHVSRSYRNADGVWAPMPYALRIYDHVWVHAGDIERGNCSHGCINLPLMPARDLFTWAKVGTPVLVVDSLRDIGPILAQDGARRLLFAEPFDPHRDGER